MYILFWVCLFKHIWVTILQFPKVFKHTQITLMCVNVIKFDLSEWIGRNPVACGRGQLNAIYNIHKYKFD